EYLAHPRLSRIEKTNTRINKTDNYLKTKQEWFILQKRSSLNESSGVINGSSHTWVCRVTEMSDLKRLIYFYDANDISALKLIRYSIISASGSAGLSPKSLCRSKSPCICAKACSPILTEVSNCDESSTVSSPVKVRLKVLHPYRQYHSVTASKRCPALPNFGENKVAEEFHIFQDRTALIQI
ncbi:hypothetical protein ALC57_16698, partial [Trachymyrmex cornetzi]